MRPAAIAMQASTRRARLQGLALVAALALGSPALGQEARPAARAIQKCEVNGQILYTDLSCSEGRRIASELSPYVVAPSPSSDAAGSAARHAARPFFAMPDYRGGAVAYRRNPECPHLEQRMLRVEAEARVATNPETLAHLNERLAVQQAWHQELQCGVASRRFSPSIAGSIRTDAPRP
jgi:hypothetical protein